MVAPGGTLNDGATVRWRYDDDTPVIASTVLGVTLAGESVSGATVNLADPYGVELALPDGCAFALRVTVLGSRAGTSNARDVYEVSAHTSGTLTIDNATSLGVGGGLGSLGWSASITTDSALGLRIACTPASGQTVSFKARVEAVVQPF
jgi:hypothetical protein